MTKLGLVTGCACLLCNRQAFVESSIFHSLELTHIQSAGRGRSGLSLPVAPLAPHRPGHMKAVRSGATARRNPHGHVLYLPCRTWLPPPATVPTYQPQVNRKHDTAAFAQTHRTWHAHCPPTASYIQRRLFCLSCFSYTCPMDTCFSDRSMVVPVASPPCLCEMIYLCRSNSSINRQETSAPFIAYTPVILALPPPSCPATIHPRQHTQ